MQKSSTPSTGERNALFLRLKPCCVGISQLAIKEAASPKAAQELIHLTGQLLQILEVQVERDPSVLDEKLAEYVFFPLYYIFRQIDQYPARLVETCVKTLTILIQHGWGSKLTAKLVQQILNLLVYILNGVPGSDRKDKLAEETELEALRAFKVLFKTASSSTVAASGLSDPENIPALGHGITVILEEVLNGSTPEAQVEALQCIIELYGALRDQEALASFLPGVASSLTKLLSTPARHKKIVIKDALETTRLVLTRVLSDMRTRSVLASKDAAAEEPDDNKILSSAWLKATAAQLKLALSTMMKLRTSDEPEVQEALERLCIALLDECHHTLSNCASFLVETAMVLDSGVSRISLTHTSLSDLVSIYPELAETVKTVLYNWVSGLPHAMQTSDEAVKQHAIKNLSKGIQLLRNLGIDSPTLNESLQTSLRDSILALITESKNPQDGYIPQFHMLTDGSQEVTDLQEGQYQSILLPQGSQLRVRSGLLGLIQTIAASSQGSNIASAMLEFTRESASESQIAAFWLCFEVVKSSFASAAEEGSLLDLSAFSGADDANDAVFRDLYAFSVEVLDLHTDIEPADWRLEAIALEVTAYAAQRSGVAFRPELIDVLFPITSFLGSENLHLQNHAIVTLNSLSKSCQYQNVSELLVDNVDYMVNSVSLRLNSLDISPASTQVLRMMIRLAGPRLIPFLDDVVESIFAALENYHGYPTFVENLFSVLKETVEQGVRSDQLLLKGQEEHKADHRKKLPKDEAFRSLMEFLDKQDARREQDAADDIKAELSRGHPDKPWKESEADDKPEGEDDQTAPKEGEKPPNSPTYRLLERISSLSQYYLTSPIPELRRTLLELVSTASTALSADEDAFLPLVNAIWPVIITRLRDPEAYIAIEACSTLSHLCAASGDFISSRFKTEWWDGLGKWCRGVKRQAAGSSSASRLRSARPGIEDSGQKVLIPIRSASGLEVMAPSAKEPSSSGALGQHASSHRLWEAVAQMLTSIVSFVRLDEEMFDEILELLAEVMEGKPEVKDALEAINADAVWLVRYERGLVEKLPTPTVDGFQLVPMKA
ncbi:armadillo-type protein [Stachybotrys elegans]|uniref:Armadillo-type protein n=1 Tax=Stachybotrys elegans TaxID=80388 RepID=A0A8K0SZM7_9HYPO|nr:armadillo-type protein [Stachybotrys elegans]